MLRGRKQRRKKKKTFSRERASAAFHSLFLFLFFLASPHFSLHSSSISVLVLFFAAMFCKKFLATLALVTLTTRAVSAQVSISERARGDWEACRFRFFVFLRRTVFLCNQKEKKKRRRHCLAPCNLSPRSEVFPKTRFSSSIRGNVSISFNSSVEPSRQSKGNRLGAKPLNQKN